MTKALLTERCSGIGRDAALGPSPAHRWGRWPPFDRGAPDWPPHSWEAPACRFRRAHDRSAGYGALSGAAFRGLRIRGLQSHWSGMHQFGVVVPAGRAASARGRVEHFFYEVLSEFPELHRRVDGGQLLGPVMATGPFAAWSGRVIAPGVLLVGDAADFFDPATGDGIHSALRGAELVAESMIPALSHPAYSLPDALRNYRRLRRQAFAGKWMLERFRGRCISPVCSIARSTVWADVMGWPTRWSERQEAMCPQ